MAEKAYEYFKGKYNETSIHDEKSDFYFFATILGEFAVTNFWEDWRAFLDLTEICEKEDTQ